MYYTDVYQQFNYSKYYLCYIIIPRSNKSTYYKFYIFILISFIEYKIKL